VGRLAAFLAGTVLLCGAAFALAGAHAGQRAEKRGTQQFDSRWEPAFGAAKRYARGRSGDVRFMFIDPWKRAYRFNHAGSAPMASLFKAMLLTTYLSEPDVRDRSLRESDRDLLGPMIKRSDNVTATRVRDIVGAGSIRRTARKADMEDFSYHSVWGLSRTSPRDQAHFFGTIERYIPERHEDYALNLLADIVPSQRWGVGKVDPRGWSLHFKGGWGDASGRVDHQSALYLRGPCRASVSIMTEFNPSHRYGKATLEGVAERLMRGFGQVTCSKRTKPRHVHAPGLQFDSAP
jgi:hypothetical protein